MRQIESDWWFQHSGTAHENLAKFTIRTFGMARETTTHAHSYKPVPQMNTSYLASILSWMVINAQ